MEINLNSEKIVKIIEKGLNCNQYITLVLLKNNEIDLAGKTYEGLEMIINGWLNISHSLTPKATKFLEEMEGKQEEIKSYNYYQVLYNTLQAKMTELTGKKQKLLQGKYYFMPSYIDFQSKLSKVVKKYKLSDWNKVEKVLISYICRANKARFEMMPLLGYYIEKNGNSQLASEYENFVEGENIESGFKSQQKFV